MPATVRDYLFATDLAEAVKLLQHPEISAWVPAPRMPDAPAAPILLDLQRLNLGAITAEDEALVIGGLATLEALATHPVAQVFANGILAQAARLSAHRGLRNLATLEGALRSYDGPPEVQLALAVLNSEFRLWGGHGEVTSDMLAQPPATSVLIDARVPLSGQTRGALVRVARTPLDQAIVAAAAILSPGVARVAVAADAATLNCIAWELNGDPVDESTISSILAAVMEDVQPEGDYRGSVEYRRAMAELLARRALLAALQQEVPA